MSSCKKNRRTIRFGENIDLRLTELSQETNSTVSTLVRALCKKGIDELTDKNGNWILPKKKE